MKKTPPGWPRIASAVFYDDAAGAIDWLCDAFGFRVRMKVEGPGGRIEHSELELGDGLIMVGQTGGERGGTWRRSPKAQDGACTQSLMAFVDDADAHCAHARAAGATITTEPATSDYGAEHWVDRGYEAIDREGHHWWFVQRVSTSATERKKRKEPSKKSKKSKKSALKPKKKSKKK